jgi:hypothetical protein
LWALAVFLGEDGDEGTACCMYQREPHDYWKDSPTGAGEASDGDLPQCSHYQELVSRQLRNLLHWNV